ncbi:DUF488 family protein [Candidatus Poriferisodalis sp.]|uniref:DUF488 domain-containing protein n=1 Tax=Candidatus Poriferisodalis sp. TaxID=3101277 RepID=UPI003B011267
MFAAFSRCCARAAVGRSQPADTETRSPRRRVSSVSSRAELWTIGHSNHEAGHFLGLLDQYGIEVVADVRSQPYAKYAEHFSQAPLKRLLADAGVAYVFLGRELGGRPSEPELYDDAGHVLYGEVARSKRFSEGLERLLHGAETHRVAMLCSEEDPTLCHRRLLITRALLDTETPPTIEHIRGDGRLVSELELGRADSLAGEQLALFGATTTWKSAQSVSQNTARRVSSSS